MGILGKIGTAAMKKAGIVALGKVGEKISENTIEKDRKELSEIPLSTEILLINQQNKTHTKLKGIFNIFDRNEKVKYTVKGKPLSFKHHLRIYTADGKKIGTVKEKLITLRSFFSSSSGVFTIETDGKKLGKLKSSGSFRNRIFTFDFNGWRIEGDFSLSKRKYQILNEN